MNRMLNVKINNGEVEEFDFEGTSYELIEELKFIAINILCSIIEQGGFFEDDIYDLLNNFSDDVEATIIEEI